MRWRAASYASRTLAGARPRSDTLWPQARVDTPLDRAEGRGRPTALLSLRSRQDRPVSPKWPTLPLGYGWWHDALHEARLHRCDGQ